jgi:Sulfotransferase family
MKLPNFFIVGAPKAATTFLAAYLDRHPQIYMSPLKEPNYFASEMRPENLTEEDRARVARGMREIQAYLSTDMREKRFSGFITTWEDYLKLFRNVSDQIAIGEASPCYLWSQTAARNIASRVPHARIIISLRNPVDRAFSHYLHQLTDGTTRRTFRQEIEAALRADHRPSGLEAALLEFGHYCGQIKRYQQEFPRSQIHFSFYEDLQRDPVALMQDLLTFLGVDSKIKVELPQPQNEPRIPKLNGVAYLLKRWRLWSFLRNLLPQPLGPRLRSLLMRSRGSLVMDPADRAFLIEYYGDEIKNLSTLIDRDLRSWLQPDRTPAASTLHWDRA